MRASIVTFAIGLLVGFVLCAMFFWLRGESGNAPAAAHPHDPVEISPLASPDGLLGGERVEVAAPVIANVDTQSKAATAVAKPTAKHSQPDHYWTPLGELQDCLKRSDLNPEGLVCPNKEVRDSLDRLIRELNAPLLELAETRATLIDEIAKAKIISGLDPKATWDAYPKEKIIARSMVNGSTGGKPVAGWTVVLQGDDHDLDQTIESLKKSKQMACEKLKEQIALLCVH